MAGRLRLPLFRVPNTADETAALGPVLAGGQLAGGPVVAEFESRLAAAQDAPACLATSDGQGALALAMRLFESSPATRSRSPMTCTATAMPVAMIGARPRWLDVDPLTGMPQAGHLVAGIGPKTKAAIIYHWAGDVADLEPLAEVCRANGVALIQEAAEGWGASYRGRPIGAAGDATVLSFYATCALRPAMAVPSSCRIRA